MEHPDEQHQLTVVRDDGLHRHLVLASPGTTLGRVDIVTWPHHLYVGGGGDGFIFAAHEDVFELFRSRWGSEPSVSSLAQKVIVGSRTYVYDPCAAQRYIDGVLEDYTSDYGQEMADDFVAAFGTVDSYADEQELCGFLSNYSFLTDGIGGRSLSIYPFTDLVDYTFSRWSEQYVRLCRAVQSAVASYDQRDSSRPADPLTALHAEMVKAMRSAYSGGDVIEVADAFFTRHGYPSIHSDGV